MKPRHLLPAAAVPCAIAVVVALAGCGNKGPLVRASDVPPPVVPAAAAAVAPDGPPAATPDTAPAAGDATLPELTPPAEPPVTDTVAPPAQDDGD